MKLLIGTNKTTLSSFVCHQNDFLGHPSIINDWDSVPHIDFIKMWLENAGLKAKEYGQRITSHPGPFNVLVSPNENVVQNTITDLTIHGDIFDMMGLSQNTIQQTQYTL